MYEIRLSLIARVAASKPRSAERAILEHRLREVTTALLAAKTLGQA